MKLRVVEALGALAALQSPNPTDIAAKLHAYSNYRRFQTSGRVVPQL